MLSFLSKYTVYTMLPYAHWDFEFAEILRRDDYDLGKVTTFVPTF